MSAENYSEVKHYRTSISGRIPALSSISDGELALNIYDGKIFLKDVNNQIIEFLDDSHYNDVTTLVRSNSAAWTGGTGDVSVILNSASWKTDFQDNSSYIGKALPNTSENSPNWYIKKITLNNLGEVISIGAVSNVTWNSRLSATYN